MNGLGQLTATQPLLVSSFKKANTVSKKISIRDNAKSPLSQLSNTNINDIKKSNQELEDKLRWSSIFDDMMESCITSPQHIAFESHMPLFFHSNRAILWEKRPNSNSFLSRTLKSEVSSSCSLIQQVINSNKPIIPDLTYDSDIILSFSLQSFDHQFFVPFRYPDETICAIVQLSRHQNCSPFGQEEITVANFLMKKFKIYGSPFFQKERVVGLASKVSQIGPLSKTANQIKKTIETSFQCSFADIWFLQLNNNGYYRFDTKVRDFIGVYKCSAGAVGHCLRNASSTAVFTINSEKVGDVKNFSSSSDGEPNQPVLMSSLEFEGRVFCVALRGERTIGCYTKDDQNRLSSVLPFIARSLSFSGGFLRQNVSNEKKSIDSKVRMISIACSTVSSLDIEDVVTFVEEKSASFLNAEFCRVLVVDNQNQLFLSDFDQGIENCKKNSVNKGVAGSTFSEKLPLILSNPEDDERFDSDVDIGKSTKIRNILSVPVFDENNSVIAVFVASNKNDGDFNESDKSNLSILATFFGIALKNAQRYSSSFVILSKLNEFLKNSNLRNDFSKEGIEKVLMKIKEIVNASYISLYFVLQSDSSLHELVTLGDKKDDLTQYLTVCLKSGKPSTFSIENDQGKDIVCCVPVFDDDKIIGVIEFCYKSSEFIEEISLIESFAIITSSSLNKSYLKEISDFEEEKTKLCEIIGQENMELFDTPNSLVCSIEDDKLFDATFVFQENSELDLIKIVFKCFDHYHLKQEFRINNQKMFLFISNISKTYKNTSYSNWQHAVSSCLFCAFLLMKTKLDESLNKIEIFCLFVAALGHDSGQNHDDLLNSTNEKEQICRSILFKNSSVVEMNHCIELINVLSKESSNILSEFDENNSNSAWKLIFYLIMQTDLSKHFMIINEYLKIQKENSFSLKNADHRKLLLSLFLKCADFSDCFKKFDIFNNAAKLISDEFFSQGSLENVGGMKFKGKINKRQFLDKEKSLPGFLKFVVLPLFEAVCEYNKDIQYIKEYLVTNIDKLEIEQAKKEENDKKDNSNTDDNENEKQEANNADNENDKKDNNNTDDNENEKQDTNNVDDENDKKDNSTNDENDTKNDNKMNNENEKQDTNEISNENDKKDNIIDNENEK